MPHGAFAKLEQIVNPEELTFFTKSEREQLAMLAEAMIPETDTPGAIKAGVPAYIEVIVKDCYGPAEQKLIRWGLGETAKRCQQKHGRTLAELPESKQVAFLEKLSNDLRRNVDATVEGGAKKSAFLDLFKSLTTYCFCCSELGATQALDYLPVPGKWIASMPLEKGQKAWAL